MLLILMAASGQTDLVYSIGDVAGTVLQDPCPDVIKEYQPDYGVNLNCNFSFKQLKP